MNARSFHCALRALIEDASRSVPKEETHRYAYFTLVTILLHRRMNAHSRYRSNMHTLTEAQKRFGIRASSLKTIYALPYASYAAGEAAVSVLNAAFPSPLEIDARALTEFYERFIEETERKQKGQYFTPDAAARYMTGRLGAFDGALFDPALGAGALVIHAAERMLTEGRSTKEILSRIGGFEILPFSFALACLHLLITLAPSLREPPAGEPLTLRIVCADALHMVPETPSYAAALLNPPYIGEKGNKALFNKTLTQTPYWKTHYKAKMDYLYWFIIRALLDVKEGGKVVALTTSYWLTAPGASALRAFIAARAVIEELVFLNETPLFRHAKGVHALVITLRKCSREEEQTALRPKIIRVKRRVEGVPDALEELFTRIEKVRTAPSYSDEYIETDTAKETARSFGARAFVFTKQRDRFAAYFLPSHMRLLSDVATISQGLVPNPQWTTARHEGYAPREPIFVFPEETYARIKETFTAAEQTLFKPLYKNSHIERYAVATDARYRALYVDASLCIDDYPNVRRHLERFKPILQNRRECKTGALPWYSLHWPRSRALFETPAIVCPYHAKEIAFALAPSPCYAAADVYFIQPKENGASIFFLLGILNSRYVATWLSRNGRRKGETQLLVTNALARIPIPERLGTECARIERLAKERSEKKSAEIDAEIDALVFSLYGVPLADQNWLARGALHVADNCVPGVGEDFA